jgi:hypothetical protein
VHPPIPGVYAEVSFHVLLRFLNIEFRDLISAGFLLLLQRFDILDWVSFKAPLPPNLNDASCGRAIDSPKL